jgi:phosphoglycerol transferase MdoB-like AlkP superfamily enzyme
MYSVTKYIVLRIWILLLPLAILGITEYLNRGSFREILHWGSSHAPSLFLGYLIVLGLFLLLLSLTGLGRLSFWLLSALLFFIAGLSGSKLKALGAPLFPWDVYFHNEDVKLGSFLSTYLTFPIIASILLFAIIFFMLLHRTVRRRSTLIFKLAWKERAVYAAISILLLITIFTDKPIPLKNFYHIETIPWDQTLTYDDNGFLLSSVMMTHFLRTDKPEGYSKQDILATIKDIPSSKQTDTAHPNIIVMLSEAFWDPTVMTNVSFSKDPIPFLHSLQKTYTSGTMLSPQFGGTTANVEFEVLSGNSMRLLPLGPDNVISYLTYMNHGVDSLASIMSRKGYTSTAINPFFNWFFDSRKVYKHFGFSRFISSEFFPNEFEGPNYADRTVANKIIEETEKSSGPDFIFANTMENHAPFIPNKFSHNEIEVTGDISTLSRGMLESYAHGISDADKSLQILVDFYTKKGEPTIILFFGDHLPFLEQDYMVYRDAKYLLPDDPDFLTKTHNTPFVIWNNYLPAGKEDLHLSPAYLGPYMLHMAGIQGSYYTDYLYELYKKFPVIPPPEYWEKAGIQANDLETYRKLEYDIMLGNRYAYEAKGYKQSIIDPTFTLGYGNPQIGEVSQDSNQITIKGKRFFPQSTIYLDGKNLSTSYRDETTVSAALPEDLKLGTGRSHRLEVKQFDDKKALIGQSNVWILENP